MKAPTSVEPGLDFVVTATLIVADIARSMAFYRDVLGAEVLRTGEPTFLRPGNLWLTIREPEGPGHIRMNRPKDENETTTTPRPTFGKRSEGVSRKDVTATADAG